jgi:hypothetical protein
VARQKSHLVMYRPALLLLLLAVVLLLPLTAVSQP